MALLLENSVFFHCTRTGGYWVRNAIKNAGIQNNEIGKLPLPGKDVKRKYLIHNTPLEVDQQHRVTFAFIRHPLPWLQSYWKYKNYMGWSNGMMDRMTMSTDFNDFIDKYIERLGIIWLYKRC